MPSPYSVERLDDLPPLPGCVRRFTVRFDPTDDSDLGSRFPGLALPASLDRAVPKRKVEYLAGRYCAREALRALDPALAAHPLPTSDDRAPEWPEGVVGAIAHADGIATVAVARARDLRGVGVDVEAGVASTTAERIGDHVFAAGERSRLAAQTGWDPATLLTVVFSAKESIFKCLYPEVRCYFGFHDAEVLALDESAGTFAAVLRRDLTPGLQAGLALAGRFARAGRHVYTGLALAHEG
jgi:4'-phosphopantetheinyl transferase EntD